jgi:hypothetical protein
MKFVYASLAALGAVSANFVTDMEAVFDNMWVENQDGFTLNIAEFYTGTYVENADGFTYSEQFHFPGFDETKKFSCDFDVTFPQAGFNYNGVCSGFYDQLPNEFLDVWDGLDLPDWSDGMKFNEFLYKESIVASVAGGSATLAFNSDMNNDSGDAVASLASSLTGNFGMSNGGQSASVTINFEAKTDISGFSQNFVADNNVDAKVNAEFTVSDVPKCQTFLQSFKGKGNNCNLDYSFDWDTLNFGSNDVSGNVNLAPMRFAFSANHDDEIYKVIVRGEKSVGAIYKPCPLFKQELYAIYYANQENVGKAIQSGAATLVVRVPGPNVIVKRVAPTFMTKAQPWIEFGLALGDNPQHIPQLAYHFDSFLATFDDEFDFSTVIKASHFESDLVHYDHSKYNSLNAAWQARSQRHNAWIIKNVMNCPEMKEFFVDMREFVEHLASAEGLADYQQTWGTIF